MVGWNGNTKDLRQLAAGSCDLIGRQVHIIRGIKYYGG